MRPIDFIVLGIIILALIVYNWHRKTKQPDEDTSSVGIKRSNLQAAKFLEQEGFNIIAYEQNVPARIKIDGRVHYEEIPGDLLVEKEGLRYIVAAKTGKNAGKVGTNRNERRELLDLYLLHKPDGIIWVDLSKKRLHWIDIEMDAINSRRKHSKFWRFLIAAGLGAIAFWAGSILWGMVI